MSFKHIIFSAACVLLLSACGNETSNNADEVSSINKEQQQQSDNKQQPNQQEKAQQDDDQENKTIDEENTEDAEQEGESVDGTDSEKVEQQVIQPSKSTEQEVEVDENENENENEQNRESGFSVVNGAVESAKDVPKVDEIAILAAFDEYIAAFNAEDIDRYEKVLAQNPEGFDLEEDLVNSKRIFDNFEVHREASNITITEYTGSRAYVYADVVIDVKQDNSSSHDEGKQLTQFVKESSGWKVTSLQAIGSAAKD